MASKAAADKYDFEILIYVSQDQTISDGATIMSEIAQKNFGTYRSAHVALLNGHSLHHIALRLDEYKKHSFTYSFKDVDDSKGGGRVYLLAHGDTFMQKLGAYDAEEFAQILRMTMGNARLASSKKLKVKLVSILGCLSGYTYDLFSHSLEPFAKIFHRNMRDICETVYARTKFVGHYTDGGKYTRDFLPAVAFGGQGEPLPSPIKIPGSVMHHRPKSKLVYYWEGNQQRQKYYEYLDHSSKEELPD